MALTSTDASQIAHSCRRLAFAAHPGLVDSFDGTAPREVARQLAADTTPLPVDPATFDSADEELDAPDIARWWLDRLAEPNAGIHERMTWFWHGHLTSSADAAAPGMLWNQHLLLREHALGNFRELLAAITLDAAMLEWLDGNGSVGSAPNENYAREVMELFALGVGNYTEDDVRAAARGLSGWSVDWETGDVTFDNEHHYRRPVTLFGKRSRMTASDVIDAICDQPACARHVANAIHLHLAGVAPTPRRLDDLATVFRNAELDIHPLVEAIVDHDEFHQATHRRPRSPIEWLVAVIAAVGFTPPLEAWRVQSLGQVPFYPPNVAGWPIDERWLGASQVLGRLNLLLEIELPDQFFDDVDPTVDAILQRCGLYEVSDRTRTALDGALTAQTEYARGTELTMVLALASPEFALA